MDPNFETELAIGIGSLSGGILEHTIKEKDDKGNFQESLIIRNDREWQVAVKWALVGTMLDVHWLDIRGKWILKAYLEGWGKNADEMELDGDVTAGILVEPPQNETVLGDPAQTAWVYEETFTFKPKTVKPGTYKLAVTITFEHDPGQPGPMAGFIEFGNMIQIYDPGN